MNVKLVAGATALALGLALTSAAAGPASAAVVTWTFSGTVEDGFDTTGLFGAANTSLSGDAYAATYTFDTSKGTLTQTTDYSYLSGGPAPSGPFQAAKLTTKGVAVSISGISSYASSDFAITTDAVDYNEMEASIGEGDLSTSYSYLFNAISGVAGSSASFDSQFTSSGASNLCLESSCDDHDNGSFGFLESSTKLPSTYGYFDVDKSTKIVATVAGVSGVPEPATWVMMIIGLGGVGAAMRTSRGRQGIAAA